MPPIYQNPTQPVEARVDDLLNRMTIAEKIGQMAQVDIRGIKSKDEITNYFIGSVLSGGGAAPIPNTPSAWADMVAEYQLPLLDALVAAWLPGTEGQGIADVLFGNVPFTGKLSFTWPRSMAQVSQQESIEYDGGPLFVYGYGL